MPNLFLNSAQFAQDAPAGGISALGLNLKSFLFQLTTFLIVFFLLRRFVFSKLVTILEKRREVLENSLVQARETEKILLDAEAKSARLLQTTRKEADAALAEARAQAQALIAAAEKAGAHKAELMLAEAQQQIRQAELKLRRELQTELAGLVADATEKVIYHKLDKDSDAELIQKAIKEVAR